LTVEPDFEYVLVDATICKAHADASGANVWPAPIASGDWVMV
jgi:hypothetical protein